MTKLLQKAFELASTLSDEQQDALADAIIAGLEADRRWDRLFEASIDRLDLLAEEALDEFQRDATKPLETSSNG